MNHSSVYLGSVHPGNTLRTLRMQYKALRDKQASSVQCLGGIQSVKGDKRTNMIRAQ